MKPQPSTTRKTVRDRPLSKLVERTVKQLLKMLSDVEAGSRCPRELDAAATCEVSRTTVREAYLYLEDKGLIERRSTGRHLRRCPRREDQPQSVEPVETKDQTVVRILLQRIGKGEIQPGQRLSERTLATELGCSVTPVREALLSLAPLGLFEKENRRQWQAVRLNRVQCRELTELRRIVEGYCLRKACDSGWHQSEATALKALHRKTSDLLKDGIPDQTKFLDVDVAFHTSLLESSGNSLLIERNRFIYALINFQLGNRHFTRDRARLGIQQHINILDALLDDDREAAESRLMEHIEAAGQTLIQLAEAQGER